MVPHNPRDNFIISIIFGASFSCRFAVYNRTVDETIGIPRKRSLGLRRLRKVTVHLRERQPMDTRVKTGL